MMLFRVKFNYRYHFQKYINISCDCWSSCDSSFVFGGLLDSKKGGRFSIQPVGEFTSKQYYIENTNVLRTERTTAEGTYRITDFAPRFRQYERYFKPLMLVRKVEPLSGRPRIRIICEPVGA